MSDFWAALHGFNGVKPAERQNGPRRSEVGTLPEGDYEFQIADVENKVVGDDEKALLILGLRVMWPLAHASQILDLNYWLTDEGAVSRCFADLVVLGMDDAAPFAAALQAFLPKLLGRRFKGRRKDNTSDRGKIFNNLYVNQFVGGSPMAEPRRQANGTVYSSLGAVAPLSNAQPGNPAVANDDIVTF